MVSLIENPRQMNDLGVAPFSAHICIYIYMYVYIYIYYINDVYKKQKEHAFREASEKAS